MEAPLCCVAVPVKNPVLATRLLRDGIVSSFFSFFLCVALSQRRDGPEFLRALTAKTKVRRTLHQKQKSPLGPRSPATENEGVSHTSPTTEKAPAGIPAAPAPVGFARGPHPFRRSWRPLQPEHLLRVGRLLERAVAPSGRAAARAGRRAVALSGPAVAQPGRRARAFAGGPSSCTRVRLCRLCRRAATPAGGPSSCTHGRLRSTSLSPRSGCWRWCRTPGRPRGASTPAAGSGFDRGPHPFQETQEPPFRALFHFLFFRRPEVNNTYTTKRT